MSPSDPPNPADQPGAGDGSAVFWESKAFVEKLGREVSGKQLELPAFPDVVLQLRRALQDSEVGPDRLARIVSADAGLAARVIRMANSVVFSRGGAAVTDLKKAMVRIGFQNVRSAALSFALQQLRMSGKVRHIRGFLEQLWQDSTLTAALAYEIARTTRAVDPEEALLAGLMHNIGKVYILSRLEPGSPLMIRPAVRGEVLRDWNAHVGRAIAENWDMPDAICQAIADQDQQEREHNSRADLTDVLIVAVSTAASHAEDNVACPDPGLLRPFEKLSFAAEDWKRVIEDSGANINELRAALGG